MERQPWSKAKALLELSATVGPLRKVTRHWRRASLGRKHSEVRPSRAVLLYRNSHRRKKAAI
jgi:hypothetical protein